MEATQFLDEYFNGEGKGLTDCEWRKHFLEFFEEMFLPDLKQIYNY